MTTDVQRRGLMLILSSPSGAGKTTLSRLLLQADEAIRMSVSVTTRPARPGEVNGNDYIFVSESDYNRMVVSDEFLEHARVFDHYYGTPRAAVMNALAAGKDVLFDIDWQGTQQLAEKAAGDVVRVFILPPSGEELLRRLRTRAQDPEDVVARRMAKARSEISHWPEYDYVIVNRDLQASLADLRSILQAERLRRVRQVGLSDFVSGLKLPD